MWYFERLSSSIGGAIRSHAERGAAGAAAIGDQILFLPQEALARIIAAPQTFKCLTESHLQAPADFLIFLHTSMLAERCRLNIGTRSIKPTWTALGDVYFPPGPRNAGPLLSAAVEWAPEQEYRAPIIRGGIPIDFFSPYARSQSIIASERLSEFYSDEVETWHQGLQAAVNIIANVSEPAMHLVATFLSQIALIKTTDFEALDSFSFPSCVGRATLVVGPGQVCDPASVADTLIHEAIHSLLYTAEMHSGSFLTDESPRTSRVTSPWTGNEIGIHSFIHACFVWFGLYQFWTTASDVVASADELSSVARCGFIKPEFRSILFAIDGMPSNVRKLIIAMQETAAEDTPVEG